MMNPGLSCRLDRYSVCQSVVNIAVEYSLSDPDCTLEVWEVGKNRACEFNLDPAGSQLLLYVYTHLLDDGPVFLYFKLLSKGKVIDTDEVHLDISNSGELAENVTSSLVAAGVPWISDQPCDSSYFDPVADRDIPWFDKPDALDQIPDVLSRCQSGLVEKQHLSGFVNDGYMVIEGFLNPEEIDRLLEDMKAAERAGFSGYEQGSSTRMVGLHQFYPAFSRLFNSQRLRDVVGDVFSTPACVCQSLGYAYGSQQDFHQDTVHLTPYPSGFMCGAWLALEDVLPGSGELQIVPGSHRFPRVMMKDVGCSKVTDDWNEFEQKVVYQWRKLINESNLSPMRYDAKAGSLLVWHENLMHGGLERLDTSITRRSVVFHLFADGCVCYYDSSGMGGNLTPRNAVIHGEAPKRVTAEPRHSDHLSQ